MPAFHILDSVCFEKSLRWWWKLEIKVEITWQNLIVIFAGYGHQKLCGLLGGITDFPKLRLCHLVTRSYGRDHLYDTTIHRLHHFSYTMLRDIIQYSINIMEKRVCKCYVEPIYYSTNEFAKMLAIDACFIIKLSCTNASKIFHHVLHVSISIYTMIGNCLKFFYQKCSKARKGKTEKKKKKKKKGWKMNCIRVSMYAI